MSSLAPFLDQSSLQETLITYLDHTMPACAPIDYRLVGTASALLQGVPLPAKDIDILVKNRAEVDAFGAALAAFECLVPPAWLPEMRQYYANYSVNGVEVGISTVEIESEADTIETFGRGPWDHFLLVTVGKYQVPAVALELRLITELYRDRPDRYKPLIEFIIQHGCDHGFLKRGLEYRGLPQVLWAGVLKQLEQAPFKAMASEKLDHQYH